MTYGRIPQLQHRCSSLIEPCGSTALPTPWLYPNKSRAPCPKPTDEYSEIFTRVNGMLFVPAATSATLRLLRNSYQTPSAAQKRGWGPQAFSSAGEQPKA